MDVEATIGHFNLIIVDSLVMKKESRIGHLNFIKGGFDVLMDEKSSIHNLNKISSIAVLYESVCLHLRRNARIGVSHFKSLKNKGAYVSPPVIHLDYSFDEAVLKLKGREMMSRIYKKQIT